MPGDREQQANQTGTPLRQNGTVMFRDLYINISDLFSMGLHYDFGLGYLSSA